MIAGVSMVKDEDDILAFTIEHLLAEGVDRLIVADNLSTDGTRDILESFPEVTVVVDDEVGYFQSHKVTALAHQAAAAGATWVVPFDADELWHGVGDTLVGCLDLAAEDVVSAEVFDHVTHASDDPSEINPYLRIQHREPEPERFPVVAFRPFDGMVVGQGNHSINRPGGERGLIGCRHFQYRSWSQFVRKLRNGKAAYDATDLPAWEGAHWREWGALSDDDLVREWEQLRAQPLVHDPAPYKPR